MRERVHPRRAVLRALRRAAVRLDLDVDAAGEGLPAGAMVGGYRIVEALGVGGMGRVYVAEHLKLGRRVAIKMLRSELVSNPKTVARFFAEARAVNRISHEHIVEITDFIEQPGGDNCIVMELLRGEDLGARLQRKLTMPLTRALDIVAQIASALEVVHAAGIIHRDLKPDNIFLIERGGSTDFVKLFDFGVAKLTDATGKGGIAMHSTAAGQIIGTPEYMSPEQAGGQQVDHRTDIYSLGVILYEMLAGQLPFEAKTFGELLVKHMTNPVELPPPQPDLPPGAQAARDALLLDLLAKDPNERPRTMQDVERRARDLLELLGVTTPKRRASTDDEERGRSPSIPPAARTASGEFTLPRRTTPAPDSLAARTSSRELAAKTPTPPSLAARTASRELAAKTPTPPPEAEAVARVKLKRASPVPGSLQITERVAPPRFEPIVERSTPPTGGVERFARASTGGRLAKSSTEAERRPAPKRSGSRSRRRRPSPSGFRRRSRRGRRCRSPAPLARGCGWS